MGESLITRKASGGGATKINYTNAGTLSVPAGLVKRTNATALATARTSLDSATVGDFALIAGGFTGSYSNVVDAYSLSLVRTTPTSLSTSGTTKGISFNNLAFFAIGHDGASAAVNTYNTSLTRTIQTAFSPSRSGWGIAKNSSFVLIGGGSFGTAVDAYNTSLTRSVPTALSQARSQIQGGNTSDNNLALFAGGTPSGGSTNTNRIDVYDTSLTRTTNTLGTARYSLSSANINSFVLFAGGYTGTAFTTAVDRYDNALTRTSPTALSVARSYLSGVSMSGFALFSGGDPSGQNVVDAYNVSLNRTTPSVLSTGRSYHTSVAIGNYAIIAGGSTSGVVQSTVEVYENVLFNTYTLTTPALSNFVITYNYDFTNIGSGTIGESQTLNSGTSNSLFTGSLTLPENIQ